MDPINPSPPASAIDEQDPIQLQVPIHVIPETGSVRSVSSRTPFMINGVKVWSSTPIHIYASEEGQHVLIQPTDGLGSEFVQGWNKLPDELKTRVLAFNLVAHKPIDYWSTLAGPGPNKTQFDHHLRTTSEIATLAKEIYYNRNTFSIEESSFSFTGQAPPPGTRGGISYLAYPNPTINCLIRSLKLDMLLTDMNSEHLIRLSNGTYGFPKLLHLEIVFTLSLGIRTPEDVDSVFELLLPFSIYFGCKGKVLAKAKALGPTSKVKQQQLLDLEEKAQAWLGATFKFGRSNGKCGVVADTYGIL